MDIRTAAHFIQLRESDRPEDHRQATWGHAPDEVWFELIDHHPAMRRWVAQNKTLSERVLRRLSKDPDVRVRYAVATTPNLPADLAELFAHDGDAGIRRVVVTQDNLPLETLRELTHDPDPDVAGDAEEQLSWVQRN